MAILIILCILAVFLIIRLGRQPSFKPNGVSTISRSDKNNEVVVTTSVEERDPGFIGDQLSEIVLRVVKDKNSISTRLLEEV